jgi:hypothetical protein
MNNRQEAHDRQVGGDHYLAMGLQPWEAMRAWLTPEQLAGFMLGNCIKYLARFNARAPRQRRFAGSGKGRALLAALDRIGGKGLIDQEKPYADCTCGYRIAVTRELAEAPQGTPFHCPACQKVWLAWQLIVRCYWEVKH